MEENSMELEIEDRMRILCKKKQTKTKKKPFMLSKIEDKWGSWKKKKKKKKKLHVVQA